MSSLKTNLASAVVYIRRILSFHRTRCRRHITCCRQSLTCDLRNVSCIWCMSRNRRTVDGLLLSVGISMLGNPYRPSASCMPCIQKTTLLERKCGIPICCCRFVQRVSWQQDVVFYMPCRCRINMSCGARTKRISLTLLQRKQHGDVACNLRTYAFRRPILLAHEFVRSLKRKQCNNASAPGECTVLVKR